MTSPEIKQTLTLSLCALLLWGCGGDPQPATGASQADAMDDADAQPQEDLAEDQAPDAPEDLAPDADAADLEPDDVAPDLDEPDLEPAPCPAPPPGPAPPGGRWALSMFHFNVQYVAGGLIDFDRIALNLPVNIATFQLDEAQVEDRIITESLVPLLGILERNPALALTVELQGLMVDLIRARHPEALARMRALAQGGQLELASIHWSDQFFLAFGARDMDQSWRLTRESFEAAQLPLSRAVFTQEGQFGEGFAAWLVRARPDAVMVMARNLQRFHQEPLENQPLWSVRGLDVVLPREIGGDQIQATWTFFDDGELLATNDLNPYVGTDFRAHQPSIRDYERQLQCLHQNGYRVGRVSDFVDAARAVGVQPAAMPPSLDGTWQPRSTRGPLRWMGGRGTTGWARHEQDLEVLRACTFARSQVMALEVLLNDQPALANEHLDALDLAWRELLLGQVSDARGVNPWYGEVQYGLQHCGAAGELASDALEDLRARLGARAISIDTLTGEVSLLDGLPLPEPPEVVEAPIQLQITEDGGRQPELAWTASRAGPPSEDNPYTLTITWPPVPEAAAAWERCLGEGKEDWECMVDQPPLAVRAPREAGLIGYRPAFLEEAVRYTEADFQFQAEATQDAAWTVASDGFLDLGQDRYLIKNTHVAHMAVGFLIGEGRNDAIELRDETTQPASWGHWSFWYTTSRARAEALAQRNHWPVVTFGQP